MRKELAKYSSMYRDFYTFERKRGKARKDSEPEITDTQLYNVLKEIYSVDPVSGLPKGDIQYFLSPNANPQVQAWLQENLLQPRAKQKGTSIEGVTDDMIVEYSRKFGESVNAYQRRLQSIFDESVAVIEQHKRDTEYIKSIQPKSE